jgi:predicted transcriptional regulator
VEDQSKDQYNAQIAMIAAAYLSNPSTKVETNDLADVIRQIGSALANPAVPEAPEPEPEKPTAAAIRKSITPSHLISFVDGKPYKSLKRHLSIKGYTPEAYRERYGLSRDYPMTAPNYSAQRSELAKKAGLGQLTALRRRPGTETTVSPTPAVEASSTASAPAPAAKTTAGKAPKAKEATPATKPIAEAAPAAAVTTKGSKGAKSPVALKAPVKKAKPVETSSVQAAPTAAEPASAPKTAKAAPAKAVAARAASAPKATKVTKTPVKRTPKS